MRLTIAFYSVAAGLLLTALLLLFAQLLVGVASRIIRAA